AVLLALPPRRSSDLGDGPMNAHSGTPTRRAIGGLLALQIALALTGLLVWALVPGAPPPAELPPAAAALAPEPASIESASPVAGRSEEHTSELQSREN